MREIEDIVDDISTVKERMKTNSDTLARSKDSVANCSLTEQNIKASELLLRLKQELVEAKKIPTKRNDYE